jgi:hypothetical protein
LLAAEFSARISEQGLRRSMFMWILIGALDWLCWRIWYGQFGYQRSQARWRGRLRRQPQDAEATSGSGLSPAQSGSITP